MNKQVLYKSLLKEISDVIKKNLYESESKIIDPEIGFEFDITDIPIDVLKKQYVNFKLYRMPPAYGDLLYDSSKNKRLTEGVNVSYDPTQVRDTIIKNYHMDEWQCQVLKAENEIHVIVVAPLLDENESLIEEDMESMGYYKCNKWIQSSNGLSFVLIRFDPQFPQSVNNMVRQLNVLIHLSPVYNHTQIQQYGFIPKHQNEKFTYPPRIYFIKGNVTIDDVEYIGNQLCHDNHNVKNNGDYIMYILSVKKIPSNVTFYGDSCYKHGVCTYDPIPYDAVISTQQIKFNK